MNKLINRISLAIVWGSALGVLIIGALLLCPVKIAEFHSPFKVLDKKVMAGGSIRYVVDYCKFKNYHATVYPTLVDEYIFNGSPQEFSTTTDGSDCFKKIFSYKIPDFLPSDTYKLQFNIVYDVNPIKKTTYTAYTEDFEVIAVDFDKDQDDKD